MTRSVHDTITESLDFRVEDFPEGAPGYLGTDPNDAHVHAGAVAGRAEIVLTADRGFTRLLPEQLALLPYDVYEPDPFFILVDDSAPEVVRAVTGDQLSYWCSRRPSGGINLPAALEDAGCPGFAERVRQHLQEL